jgi:hypothetical protein
MLTLHACNFHAGSILDVHLRRRVPALIYVTAASYGIVFGACIYGTNLHFSYGPWDKPEDRFQCYSFGHGIKYNANIFSLNAVFSHWSCLASK